MEELVRERVLDEAMNGLYGNHKVCKFWFSKC
jgi:hypothetical protein